MKEETKEKYLKNLIIMKILYMIIRSQKLTIIKKNKNYQNNYNYKET